MAVIVDDDVSPCAGSPVVFAALAGEPDMPSHGPVPYPTLDEDDLVVHARNPWRTSTPEPLDMESPLDDTPVPPEAVCGTPLVDAVTLGLVRATTDSSISPHGDEPRRVSFNYTPHTVHKITPYSEVYGVHPKLFDFDADGNMMPVGTGCTSRSCDFSSY